MGSKVKFYFQNLKRHILALNRIFLRIFREDQCGLGCRRDEEPEIVVEPEMRNFTLMWRRNPWSDLDKILPEVDVCDIITVAHFGNDRLRSFSVAMGQILGFSVDFHRRPYNSRTTVRVCDYPRK